MIPPSHWCLLNGDSVEALPTALAKPRGNLTARQLASAAWLIRRKLDGRFLAIAAAGRVRSLQRGNLDARTLADVAALPWDRPGDDAARPLHALQARLRELGVDADDYARATGLSLVPEPRTLRYAGRDRYHRPLWLQTPAARAWRHMRSAAREAGVLLQAISGYRSHDYQLSIFRRKLARGLSVPEILAVNAAPGFSEHHSGLALDIGTPGEPPAEESFETTVGFEWLQHHAGQHGFRLSYPRGNPHGIVYEPWHWCWRPSP